MRELILTSSVLITAIALLRRLLRGKLDPRVQYALWLLAAVRLLVPGTFFHAPVSVAGAAAELERAVQIRTSVPPETDGIFVPDQTYLVQGIPGGGSDAPSPPERTGRDWPDLIWKAGMCVMAGAMLLTNFHFLLTLRTRRRRLDISCGPLAVYAVKGLASPCLAGVLRPAVYLTEQAREAEHIDYVLTHEYTHFRHGDHLWALVRSACLIVHWYNPLVWWAALLSRRDCELACDAGAIARLGEERRLDYGQTLLRLVPAGRGSLLHTATTMTAGKRTMVERVAFIARRPKMLKVTLAAVVLVMCAAAAVTFGGAAEPPEDVAGEPSGEDEAVLPMEAPGLTEMEALALYARAREAWDWFDIGLMPLTEETYADGDAVYHRVSGFDSQEELQAYLETLFAPEIVDYLLRIAWPFQDHGGGLYMQAAGRGSNLNAGEETVTAFLYTPEEAEEYGYAVHIFAQTEVLDEDLETVLGYKRHDFYAVWNGTEYVFTSFGPWDDVNVQLYYNAQEIQEQIASGEDTEDWLPLMAYMDWDALGNTGGSELCDAVCNAIYALVHERGEELTMAQYLYILSATEGLDGAWAEGFQVIVYDLYTLDSVKFAYVVLEELPEAQKTVVLDRFRYESSYQEEYPDVLSREEAAAQLQQERTAVYANPETATLTYRGETFQFQLQNVYGIYAAEYASADPDVASVDREGNVTAVNPGETTITLHYEGAAGQIDFTCIVACRWTDAPESEPEQEPPPVQEPDVPDEPVDSWEIAEEMMSWARSIGPSMSFATAAPDEELPYDGAGDVMQVVLRRLEDHGRSIFSANDFFDRIQLEGEPVLSADGQQLTVDYYIICSASTTLSNGEPYTADFGSQLLTTTYTLVPSGE